MSVDLIRGLYDYHRWANRRLFDVTIERGEDVAVRDVGPQFSYPTILRMFGHLYGADWLWLHRWQGTSPTRVPGAEFTSLGGLRQVWDAFEEEQKGFLESLTPADLARVVEYQSTQGKTYRAALGRLLQHVVNHGTHHRSEIATMLTTLGGSPPDTGINTYEMMRTGQA